MNLKKNQGLTLLELLLALVISSILIAALYRTFIYQQKTYTVQEQVADTQQNVRVAISRMMREVRMAGFGNIADDLALSGGVSGYKDVISGTSSSMTIVGGITQISTLKAEAVGGDTTVTLQNATEAGQFDNNFNRFISIGGIESNTVSSVAGAVVTLTNPLKMTHKLSDSLGNPVTVPVYAVRAITYSIGTDPSSGKQVLQRNENRNLGAIAVAENIESASFQYLDASGNPTATPANIRMVKVTVTARTDKSDPDLKGGSGYRRRQIASNINIRNIGLPRN